MPTTGPITVDGPPAAGALTFQAMTGSEGLGRCFEYEVDLLSAKADINASDVLGAPLSVDIETKNFQTRHFNGIIAALEYRGFEGPLAKCRISVRPWFWFLTRASNNRIFQHASVVDVIKEVFDRHELTGVVDFSELQGNYPKREYTVQYGETDFNFVSRLMENEGIYYFFRHTDGAHTMVLVDTYTSHLAVPDYEHVPFVAPDVHRDALLQYVSEWNVVNSAQPGTYSQRDFDFENPTSLLESSRSISKGYDLDNIEVYEYPGGFLTTGEGDDRSLIRLEELQTGFEQAFGTSNARGLAVGSTFKLTDHPRDDQNQEYLVVSADYRLRGHDAASNQQAEEEVFSCAFVAIDPAAPFRPGRTALKPTVRGPQTAIVVGPEGKEIWVDEYGRVQVQFHWDRKGEHNEKSSCFVRVSQVWAGSGWGAVFTPRIGQEVIVDFLEGDPDQPIITGRVHNGNNLPPYKPKTHPTRSGIRSHSSPDGTQTNYNEIRFEDLKGHEELHIQAERTQTTLVKGSQAISVGGDRAVTVAGNEAYTVKKKRTTEITGDESLTVVDGDVNHDLHHNVTIKVGDAKRSTIQNDYVLQSHSGQISLFRDTSQVTITQGKSVLIGTEKTYVLLDPSGDINAANQANAHVQLASGGAITVDAPGGTSITIRRGSTKIIVKDDEITIDSSGKVDIKASSTVDVAVGSSDLKLTSDGKVAIKASSTVDVAVGSSDLKLTSAGVTVTGTMIKLNS